MITLNFKLTKEDYFNYYYYSTYLAPGKKAAVIKSRLKGFFIFSFLLLLIRFTSPERTLDTFFFISIAMMASIYLLPLFTVEMDTRKQINAFLNNPLNCYLLMKTEVIISETGISAKDEFTESKYQWNAILKKEETKEYYFLFTNSIQAIVIPKRILATAVEKETLSKLMAQHISFDAEVGHLIKK
jgi:hypothetical protein